MTRETKVGILITCSFLGMVGAVLTLRHQGHAATVADRGELPAWGEPTPLAPEPVPVQTAVVTPPPAAGPPTLSVPPQTPAHTPPTPKSLPGENILLASGTGETKPPVESPPASPMGTVGTATPHADPMNPPSAPATPPAEVGGSPAPGAAPVLGGSTPPTDVGGSPAPGSAPTLGGSTPPADAGGSPSMPPAEPPTMPTPETPSNGGRIEMPPPPVTPTTPPAGAGVPVVGLQPVAPVSEPPPNVTIGPPEAARGPGAQPGVMPVRLVPTPVAADTMPEMGGAVASAQPIGLPPVGAAPVGSTPPVTLPGSSVAKVESFDEEIYRWKPADTFANVSQQFYHHPKYEKALLLFNRNHPMAAEGVKADPPVLQANQVVFIPPAHILEKRYAAVIPDLTPLPPPNAAVPPGKPPMPVTPVNSLANMSINGVPPAAVPVQPAGAVDAPRPYQVQSPAGEMMYRIAEQQLGNGNRWMEIRDLNPTWRPELPIPAGATLRLPAR